MSHIPYILLAAITMSGAAIAQVPTLGGGSSSIAPITGEQVTQLSLLADHNAVAPGQSIQLGLLFEMAEHWHIYWLNPGEAGMAPTVRWTLPDGFVISDLRWPTPIQFDQGGGIIGYGYEGKVMLTATLTAPPAEKLAQHKTIKIQAEVDWLVCKNVCLPGNRQLRLDIPVGQPQAANQPLFAYWTKRLPEPGAVTVAKVSGGAGKPVNVSLKWGKPVESVAFFPKPENDFTVKVVNVTNHGESADVTLSVQVFNNSKTAGNKIAGLVVWMDGKDRHSAEVEIPVDVTNNISPTQ